MVVVSRTDHSQVSRCKFGTIGQRASTRAPSKCVNFRNRIGPRSLPEEIFGCFRAPIHCIIYLMQGLTHITQISKWEIWWNVTRQNLHKGANLFSLTTQLSECVIHTIKFVVTMTYSMVVFTHSKNLSFKLSILR